MRSEGPQAGSGCALNSRCEPFQFRSSSKHLLHHFHAPPWIRCVANLVVDRMSSLILGKLHSDSYCRLRLAGFYAHHHTFTNSVHGLALDLKREIESHVSAKLREVLAVKENSQRVGVAQQGGLRFRV